jgi:hypothetical protein
LPYGNVIFRSSPEREPSLARLTSNLTGLPIAISKSALLVSRLRKKMGAGPSAFHASISPPSRLAFHAEFEVWISPIELLERA